MDQIAILHVEDEAAQRTEMTRFVEGAVWDLRARLTSVASATEFEDKAPTDYDAAIIDILLPDGKGTDLLADLKSVDPDFPCVMVTGQSSIDQAVRLMAFGADYYLAKPLTQRLVTECLQQVLPSIEKWRRKRELAAYKRDTLDFVGESTAICNARDLALKIAPTAATVLLRGESGVGKEVLARMISQQ